MACTNKNALVQYIAQFYVQLRQALCKYLHFLTLRKKILAIDYKTRSYDTEFEETNWKLVENRKYLCLKQDSEFAL